MAKLSIAKGSTSVFIRVFLADSSSTTGAGLTGLTSGSSGLVCYRARDDDGNAGGTQISLSGGTKGTWSSGGFVEKDSTNLPGVYEFGIPNAALATGSRSVLIMFKGATNLAPCPLEIDLGTQVDVTSWNGTAVVSPSTAGIPDINVKNINNITASPVTTIKAVQGLTTADTISTYTGNTVQTGDSFARIGAAGVGLTAVALTASQAFNNTGTWTGNIVGTLSTVTTYTGNTPQTGDNFARIGATGSGLTSLAQASALSTAQSGITTLLVGVNLNASQHVIVDSGTITGISGVTFPASVASPTNITAGTVSLLSTGLDAILIESGISASAALTNDAGTQLTSINARQALALSISPLAGLLSGAGTTSIAIKPGGNPSGNTRVAATVDSSGNRTASNIKVPT